LSRVYEALKKADAERKGSVRFTKEEGTEVHLIEDLKLSDILVTLKDPKSQDHRRQSSLKRSVSTFYKTALQKKKLS